MKKYSIKQVVEQLIIDFDYTKERPVFTYFDIKEAKMVLAQRLARNLVLTEDEDDAPDQS